MAIIAIIGGGFSGTMTAVHLLRLGSTDGPGIVLVERSGNLARGVAYGTTCPQHLLNVPASRMSALPDEPDHFLKWAQGRDSTVRAGDFLPRRLFGDYVTELLAKEVRASRAGDRFSTIAGEASDLWIRNGGRAIDILLADERLLRADHVVLATGNSPPSDPPVSGLNALPARRYARNPWSADALDGLDSDASILLVGTGHTAMDVIAALAGRGHAGKLIAVSRRGLLPLVQRSYSAVAAPVELPNTVPGLVHWVRAAVRKVEGEGGDCRAVIDSLRPISSRVWQSMSEREQARFLEHVRPYWDVHRHRLAPEIQRVVDDARASGRLELCRATLKTVSPTSNAVRVALSGRVEREIIVQRIINCTGPCGDVRRIVQPLIQNMLRRGLMTPDMLNLGPRVTPDGRLIGDNEIPSDRLWCIGPLRRSALWESTAVPEIRVQARDLAIQILQSAVGSVAARRD